MRCSLPTLVLICIVLRTPASAADALRLSVSPTVTQSPATVTIRVVVPPDPDNRELVVALDGEDFYRSSAMQLDGADAPPLHVLMFNDIPAGSYDVNARVQRVKGMATAHANLTVAAFVPER